MACEALLASNAELRQRLAATDAEGMATKAQVERLLEWQRDAIERYNALLARLKASQAAHDELVDSAAGDARECAPLSAVWLLCRLRPLPLWVFVVHDTRGESHAVDSHLESLSAMPSSGAKADRNEENTVDSV